MSLSRRASYLDTIEELRSELAETCHKISLIECLFIERCPAQIQEEFARFKQQHLNHYRQRHDTSVAPPNSPINRQPEPERH